MTREEAIETIRRCCPRVNDSQCEFETAMRELVPEFRENEDERIRNGLLNIFKQSQNGYWAGMEIKDIVAYLERQKEQKPIEPKFKVGDRIKLSEEPKYPFREIINIKDGAYYFDECVHLPFKEQDKWEKEQKHKRERNKPKESWLEKSKYELAHEEELLTKRQKELSEIRVLKDKEQKPENGTVLKGFVAVDYCDVKTTWNPTGRRVSFFTKKPVRDLLTEIHYWASTGPYYERIKLGYECFPELKWEDEPVEVELLIYGTEQKPINESNMHEPTLDEARKWNEAYEKGYSLGYKNGRNEQKSWEWSEEERKILDSIIDDYEKAAKSFCGYDGKIGLLRAIRDGEYNLPKPAWSEEDERILNELLDHCNTETATWYNWLKGLRLRLSDTYREGKNAGRKEVFGHPEEYGLQKPVEWSEEDEIGFADAIRYIQDYGETSSDKYTQLRTKEIVDWLKSLRPSWRPSEEQMEAFCRCVDYLEESDNEDADIMAELYEQLKQL